MEGLHATGRHPVLHVSKMEGLYATGRHPVLHVSKMEGLYATGRHPVLRMYLWLCFCISHLLACQVCYRRRLGSLLLCSCGVFRALINSLVC